MDHHDVRADTVPIAGMLWPDAPIAGTPDEARIVALSRVLAAQAVDAANSGQFGDFSRQPMTVKEFRAKYLSDGILKPARVDAWIHEQARSVHKPLSWWLMDVFIQEEDIQEEDRGGLTLRPGAKLRYEPQFAWSRLPDPERPSVGPKEHRNVEYATPTDPLVPLPVRADGVLDKLRLISLALHYFYSWKPAQGTMFTLTGLIPRAEARAKEIEERRGRHPREISRKNLTLAVFTQEYGGTGTHAQRMEEWNRLHPEWAFTRVQSFAWVSQQTIRRLTSFTEVDGDDG
jgi:hypothetical protein